MHSGGRRDAQAVVGEGGEPGVEEVEQVQSQQGGGQVDEDLRGVVLTQLPVANRSDREKRARNRNV